MGMRERFIDVVAELLDDDPRVAVVVADISAGRLEAIGAEQPERVVNVGIREPLMIGVAGGMALEGLRPIAHSYAPFLVDRAFEQIKLDLVHQAAGGAILVSIGGSYDAAEEGRTHQSPGDVALLATLPAVTIHVPGPCRRGRPDAPRGVARDGTAYIRLSEEANATARPAFQVVRPPRAGGPLAVAVGPTLEPVLEAVAGTDYGVAYVARVRPFPTLEIASASTPATSCWWSRTWPAPAPARSRSNGRAACAAWASATRSCGATAPAPSTAARTGSTPPGSPARWPHSPPDTASAARPAASVPGDATRLRRTLTVAAAALIVAPSAALPPAAARPGRCSRA